MSEIETNDSIKRSNTDLDISDDNNGQTPKSFKISNDNLSSTSVVFSPKRALVRSPILNRKMTPTPVTSEVGSDVASATTTKQIPPKKLPAYNVPTNNSFDALSTSNNLNAASHTVKVPSKRKNAIPPFVIVGAVNFAAASPIVLKYAKNDYSIQYMKVGTKVQVNSLSVYNDINNELKMKNIAFYTHDLNELKVDKFVVSGLPSINTSELEICLNEKNIDFLTIQQVLVKNNPRFETESIYIISFRADTTSLAELQKIKHISHVIVRWSKHKNINKGPTQCRNCFMYGHGMRNCHLPKKCSKCSSSEHSLESCVVPEDNLCCANCNGKHESNSVDCEARTKFISMRQKLSTKRNIPSKPQKGFSRSRDVDKEFPTIPKFNYNPMINPWSFNNRSAPAMSPITKQADLIQSAVESGSTVKSYRDAVLFTAEEIILITKEVFAGLAQCHSKEDQLGVIFNVAVKHIYGPKP